MKKIPCKNCIAFDICNIKAKEILTREKSHIKVLVKLTDECSLMKDYTDNTPFKVIHRHLKHIYGNIPQEPLSPLQRLVNREDPYNI